MKKSGYFSYYSSHYNPLYSTKSIQLQKTKLTIYMKHINKLAALN